MTLIYFFLSSLLIAALPGPAMMLTIQSAIQHRWQAGAMVTLGILLADSVLLLIIGLGLAELLTQSPNILFYLHLASSFYLLYLGGQSLYQLRQLNTIQSSSHLGHHWQKGFFITLINPKTIIFLIAYLPQFIQPQGEYNQQLLILSVLFLLAVAIIMLSYSFMAHLARRYLASVTSQKILALLFGLLLLYLGGNSLFHLLNTE